jgi:transcriptional regulator with XRE-family HTH domain
MSSLGKEIKQARRDRGLTQQELAAQLQLKQQYLSRLEHDRVDVRVSLLRRLAAALQVPITQLLAEAPRGRRARACAQDTAHSSPT